MAVVAVSTPMTLGISPGDRVFVDYGEETEPWHERRVLAFVGRHDHVVQTPDGDV
jgi:hypothetical protein